MGFGAAVYVCRNMSRWAIAATPSYELRSELPVSPLTSARILKLALQGGSHPGTTHMEAFLNRAVPGHVLGVVVAGIDSSTISGQRGLDDVNSLRDFVSLVEGLIGIRLVLRLLWAVLWARMPTYRLALVPENIQY